MANRVRWRRRLGPATLCLAMLSAGWNAGLSAQQAAAVVEAFSLRDGDRVVLLGSTFIERDQSHGYLEAALCAPARRERSIPQPRLERRQRVWRSPGGLWLRGRWLRAT